MTGTRTGVVAGGGASGLMAAISAAECGASVTILEHMPRVGKKILATGNGKCNLTNLSMDASKYRSSLESFPMEVIRRFPVEDTLRFFRDLGVLTTNRNGYVYPLSGQAQTVSDALRERAEELKITIITDCQIRSVKKNGSRFLTQTDAGALESDFFLLATGSKAAKHMGSDGSGYELAAALGHHILTPLPALVQLRCLGDFFPSVAGVRTEALVSLYDMGSKSGEKRRFLASDRGELQLTDYGISGIPVFQVSRYASQALNAGHRVLAVLDFFPSCKKKELVRLLAEQRDRLAMRRVSGFLNGFFHKKLAAMFLKESRIGRERDVASLTDRELGGLAALIKEFSLEVTGTNSFEQAQVCMGGVDPREINASTMESVLVRGLYFAGEVIDVDGVCGGYNLQWAWSSGRLAGMNAAEGKGFRSQKRRYI